MRTSIVAPILVAACAGALLLLPAPAAADHSVVWGVGSECESVSPTATTVVDQPVSFVACVTWGGQPWTGARMTLLVTGPTRTAEQQLVVDAEGKIRFAVQPSAVGETIVQLCDADGCVYGSVTLTVTEPAPTTTVPAITPELFVRWQRSPGTQVDPATVVPIDIFTGQPFSGEPPFPFLTPFSITTFEIAGDPADLALIVDCGGISVCTPDFPSAPGTLQVFGVTFSGNMTDPPPPGYGINFNFDTDPTTDGRFLSGVETVADCAIAGSVFGADVFGTSAQVLDPVSGEFVEVAAPLAFAVAPTGGLLIVPDDHPCAGATGFQASTHVMTTADVVVEYPVPSTGEPLFPLGTPVVEPRAVTTTEPSVIGPTPTTAVATGGDANDENGSSFPWLPVSVVGGLALAGGLGFAKWRQQRGAGGLVIAAGENAADDADDVLMSAQDDVGPILVGTEAMLQAELASLANDAGAKVAAHFEQLAQQVDAFGEAYIDAVGGASAVEEQIQEAGGNIKLAEWADLAVMVIQLSRLALGGIRGGLRAWTWIRSGRAAPQVAGAADDVATGFAHVADGLEEARRASSLPKVIGAAPADFVAPTWWRGAPSRYWEASKLANALGENLEELLELFQRGGRSTEDLLISLRRRFATGAGAVVPDQATQAVMSTVPFSMRLFERGAAVPLDKLRQIYELERAAGGTAPFLERLSKAVDLDQLLAGMADMDGVQNLLSPAALRRVRALLESAELRRLAQHPPADAPHGLVELTLDGGQKLRVFVGTPLAPAPVAPGATGIFSDVLRLPPAPGSAPTGAFSHVLVPPGAPAVVADAVPVADRVLIGARAALTGTGAPDPADVALLQRLVSVPGVSLQVLGNVVVSTPTATIRPFSDPDLTLLGHVLSAGPDPDVIRATAGPIPVALLQGSTGAVGDRPVVVAPIPDAASTLTPQWFTDQQARLDDVGAVLEGTQLGTLEHRIDELMISDDIRAHDFSLFGMSVEAGSAAARFGWAFSHLVEAPITTMTKWAHEDDLVDAWNDFTREQRPQLETMVGSIDGLVDGLRGLSPVLDDLRNRLADARGQLGAVLDQLRRKTPGDTQRIDHIAQKLAHVDGLVAGLAALSVRAALLADWLETLVHTPDGRRRDATTLLDPTAMMRVGRTLLEIGDLTAGVLGLGSQQEPAAQTPPAPSGPTVDELFEAAHAETLRLEQMTDEEFAEHERTQEAAERAATEKWDRENLDLDDR